MAFKIGDVVRTTAGRDKGNLFRIIRVTEDGKCCFLRDGKIHRMADPKKKNVKHVSAVSTGLDLGQICSDRQLKKALKGLE